MVKDVLTTPVCVVTVTRNAAERWLAENAQAYKFCDQGSRG